MSALPNTDAQRPRGPLDKLRVVDAATEIADRDGLEAVTLTEVANVLGVRQPALYRHVESYDDLIRSLGLRGREILASNLADAAIGVSGREAVAAMGEAWRETALKHPGLYTATDRYPCAGDDELEEAVERVVDILGMALSSFELSADDKVHAARTLRSAFHGFLHLELGDGHPLPHKDDDTFTHMIELLCVGIEALSERTKSKG